MVLLPESDHQASLGIKPDSAMKSSHKNLPCLCNIVDRVRHIQRHNHLDKCHTVVTKHKTDTDKQTYPAFPVCAMLQQGLLSLSKKMKSSKDNEDE